MRKDRQRRYASPPQLKDDVENYLAGRPLLAGPERRTYRLQKFLKRNRAPVAATLAAAIALAGGVAFYIHSLRAEQARTRAALIEVQRQKRDADAQKELAQKQEEEAKKQAAIA
jgi:hypothetical protein